MIDETEQLFTTPLKWATELVRIQWDFGDLVTTPPLKKSPQTNHPWLHRSFQIFVLVHSWSPLLSYWHKAFPLNYPCCSADKNMLWPEQKNIKVKWRNFRRSTESGSSCIPSSQGDLCLSGQCETLTTFNAYSSPVNKYAKDQNLYEKNLKVSHWIFYEGTTWLT